eukprot:181242-Heterocapsa_arctica.AAC.1
MEKSKNEAGGILLKAWADSVKRRLIRDDCAEPGVFVWYGRRHRTGVGRVCCKGKVPGAQTLTRKMRALLRHRSCGT